MASRRQTGRCILRHHPVGAGAAGLAACTALNVVVHGWGGRGARACQDPGRAESICSPALCAQGVEVSLGIQQQAGRVGSWVHQRASCMSGAVQSWPCLALWLSWCRAFPHSSQSTAQERHTVPLGPRPAYMARQQAKPSQACVAECGVPALGWEGYQELTQPTAQASLTDVAHFPALGITSQIKVQPAHVAEPCCVMPIPTTARSDVASGITGCTPAAACTTSQVEPPCRRLARCCSRCAAAGC